MIISVGSIVGDICVNTTATPFRRFIVYKLPKTAGSTDPHLKEGSAHYFVLPTSAEWQRSPLAINDSNSIIGRTVQPLDLVFAKVSVPVPVVQQ